MSAYKFKYTNSLFTIASEKMYDLLCMLYKLFVLMSEVSDAGKISGKFVSR